MVDCLLCSSVGSACVDGWTGHFKQRGNESGSDEFQSAKVSIPGFGWEELVLRCSDVALDRNVGISVIFLTGGTLSIIHSMPGKFLLQETNNKQ